MLAVSVMMPAARVVLGEHCPGHRRREPQSQTALITRTYGGTGSRVRTFHESNQSGGRAVGENVRYRKYYDRLLDQWIEELVMREEPVMLTEAELDLPHNPAQNFPAPRRVYVWIHYPSRAHRVKGHAMAWTKTAVKVSFFDPGIGILREGRVSHSSPTRRQVTTRDPDRLIHRCCLHPCRRCRKLACCPNSRYESDYLVYSGPSTRPGRNRW